MEYRKIGNSDLKLSVITFGAWAPAAGCGEVQTEVML
jgi:aryl-alcohol dehydrogenase-like predicted oxidoreductase